MPQPRTGSAENQFAPLTLALRPDAVVIDVEASGLHDRSYPIEVGWCDDAFVGSSFIIKPSPQWSRRDWTWDAEQIHGITWDQAHDEGVDVADVVERLAVAFGGKTYVLSDQPVADSAWIERLYRAAGRRRPFILTEQEVLIGEALVRSGPRATALARHAAMADLAEIAFPRPHRAYADARASAGLLRLALDPAYHEAVRAAVDKPEERHQHPRKGTTP